jgi:hypothetical protein
MNNKVSPQEFASKFATSKSVSLPSSSKALAKKLVLALTATLVLGSAPLAAQQGDIAKITPPAALSGTSSDYSQYTEKGAKPRLINFEVFQKIKAAKMSGVFQHPFDKNSVVTIEVEGDKDAEKRIKADLNNLFGDESGYTIQKTFGQTVANHYHKDLNHYHKESIHGNQSFHAQNPTGIGRDINYSYLDTTRSHIPNKVSRKKPEFDDYFIYHTYLHELGHSLKYQQLSLVGLAKVLFTDEDLRHMEIGADFSSSLQLYQDLTDYGVPEKKITKYLDVFSEYRYESSKVNIKRGKLPSHLGQVPTYLVSEMIKDSPDETLLLSEENIEKMSEVVFEMVEDHNFALDFNIMLDSKVGQIMDVYKADNIEDLPNKVATLVNSINKLDIKEIKIDDLSTMTPFARIREFPAFRDVIAENMKERGLWKGGDELLANAKLTKEEPSVSLGM